MYLFFINNHIHLQYFYTIFFFIYIFIFIINDYYLILILYNIMRYVMGCLLNGLDKDYLEDYMDIIVSVNIEGGVFRFGILL